ncbi:MAG: single-stranded DNA-binding protein [Mariprofundaceae bacterium]
MNIYSFTGRLGRDCETRFTQAGMAICSFTVAVDYGFGENKGTNWIRCSLFGKRAEGGLPKYLVKGTQVAISGELRVREYDDKDGNKRTSVEVSVDKLDLIGGRSEAQGGGSQSAGSGSGSNAPQKSTDPFADSPDFADVPVDDDIPF